MLKQISSTVTRAFNWLFLSLFLVVALSVALWPTGNKFGLYVSLASYILVAALILIAGIVHLVNDRGINREVDGLHRRDLIIIFAALLVVQLIVARALESSGYTWDSQIVLNAAATYGFGSHLTSSMIQYFTLDPNNIPLLCGLGAFFRILHVLRVDDFLTGAAALSACLLWLTQLLTFLVARRLYGKKFALVSLLLGFVLIGLSPQVATIYTDTLALIFPIASLYLALRAIDAQHTWARLGLSGALGVVAVLGVLMKPTAVIALIALALGGVIWMAGQPYGAIRSRLHAGRIISSLLAVLLAAFITNFAYQAGEDGMRILPFPASQRNADGTPPLHFVDIGMQTHHFSDRTEYGGYDAASAQAMSKLPDVKQRNRYSYNSIKHTLNAYGAMGYLGFLGRKTNWIMSDATFYAYGEGSNQNVVFADHSKLSGAIRSYLYIGGRRYGSFAFFSQVVWLAILLLIALQLAVQIARPAQRGNLLVTTLRLMIAGIILFVLIFEGRSRYLYLYVPMFVLLSLFTLRSLETRSNNTKVRPSGSIEPRTRRIAGDLIR